MLSSGQQKRVSLRNTKQATGQTMVVEFPPGGPSRKPQSLENCVGSFNHLTERSFHEQTQK